MAPQPPDFSVSAILRPCHTVSIKTRTLFVLVVAVMAAIAITVGPSINVLSIVNETAAWEFNLFTLYACVHLLTLPVITYYIVMSKARMNGSRFTSISNFY